MIAWGRSKKTNTLYEERVACKTEEMACAKQLVDILTPYVTKGMSVLDVGCGAGYFYHSLSKLKLEYYGIDPTEKYIKIGRKYLSGFGLAPERLQVKGIEEIDGKYDVIVCFNVIQHLPADLQKYLKTLTERTKQFLVIRSSFYDHNEVIQEYGFDKESPEIRFLNVTYPKSLVEKMLKDFNFHPFFFNDSYTKGKPEKMYFNDVLIHPGIYFASRHGEREFK